MSMSRRCPHCSTLHDTTVRCESRPLSEAWERVSVAEKIKVDTDEQNRINIYESQRHKNPA